MSARTFNPEDLGSAAWEAEFRMVRLTPAIRLGEPPWQSQFHKPFRAPPRPLFLQQRMITARQWLAEGLANKAIAARLGYRRESSFCRDFKRVFGIAPQLFARRRRRGLRTHLTIAF